jgi:hypothetical protein
MSILKTIFNITDKALDLTSLAVHGGMLFNAVTNKFEMESTRKFAIEQLNQLNSKIPLEGTVTKAANYVKGLNWKNIQNLENAETLKYNAEGIAKSGILGLTELYMTGTHLTLAYPIASLFDNDQNLENSPEFMYALGTIAALDVMHWLTSGSESTPEHV